MEDLVKLFKALGDRNRIRIVKLLQVKPLCVCEITQILGLAISTVSRHLSILKGAGLIKDVKVGKWIEYSLTTDKNNSYIVAFMPFLNFWLNDDDQIQRDREKIQNTNRYEICGN